MPSRSFRIASMVAAVVGAFAFGASSTSGGLVVASWASGGIDEGIKHYDETTGAFVSTIVPDQSGFNAANDFALGPDGMLYAAHFDHVRRHDLATTGGFGTVVVPVGGDGLSFAADVAVGPADGKLYVSS